MDLFNHALPNYNDVQVHDGINNDNNMTLHGETIASQHAGLFPNTTETTSHGATIASTQPDLQGGTDIIQNHQITGIIKENMNGDLSLYDPHYTELAHVNLDSAGNVHVMMNHSNPLSQADNINLQQLRFAVE